MKYAESLLELQKHVTNGNLRRVNLELEYLNDMVKTHNATSSTKWSMSEILAQQFPTQSYRAISPLEYAVCYKQSEIATALRQYGAPETPFTAWAPGFWNLFNYNSHLNGPSAAEERKVTPSS